MLVVGKAQAREGRGGSSKNLGKKLGGHHAPGLGIPSPRYSVENLITYCLFGISASKVALNTISSMLYDLEYY